MRIAVTARAIVLNPNGQLLIIRRSATDPSHGGKWDLPGGRANTGEDARAAAIRETREEIGLNLALPDLLYGVSAARSDGSGTWLFFAERVPADATISLGNEHDAFKWVDFVDMPKYTDYELLLGMYAYVTEHRLLELVA
ncbi:MAG TPA: NUDIX hydrolase [Patescibacteria group bacterium]|nr:NUDIX hydrolase [Patescibacteria group bacterium]